jgi:hypothetical protein
MGREAVKIINGLELKKLIEMLNLTLSEDGWHTTTNTG